MELKPIIGDILEFLTLYGDRFAIVCFGAALAIAVPLLIRLLLALARPLLALRTRAVRPRPIVPAVQEEPHLPV